MALKRSRNDDAISSTLQGIIRTADDDDVATSAQGVLSDLGSKEVDAFDVAVCSTVVPRLCDELVAAGCELVRKCRFKAAAARAQRLRGVMKFIVEFWESALETDDLIWILNELAPDPAGGLVTRLLELPPYQLNWLYLVNVYAAGVRPASMAYICDEDNYRHVIYQCTYLKQIDPRVVNALVKLPNLHEQEVYGLHLLAARQQKQSMAYVCDRANSDASLAACAGRSALWIDEEVLRALSLSPTVRVDTMYKALLEQRASRAFLVKWLTYKIFSSPDPVEVKASSDKLALFVPENNVVRYIRDKIDEYADALPALPPMERPSIEKYML